jgi:hypothetical protein
VNGDDIVLDALRVDGRTVYPEHPPDIVDRMPCVVASARAPEQPWLGVHERHRYDIEAWAPDRRAAHDLAAQTQRDLLGAWTSRRVATAGLINRVRFDAGPEQITGTTPEGVYRFRYSVTLSLRPTT